MFLSTAPQSLKWLPRQYNKVIFGFVCVPQVADVKSKMAPKQQAGRGGEDRGRDYTHATSNNPPVTRYPLQ